MLYLGADGNTAKSPIGTYQFSQINMNYGQIATTFFDPENTHPVTIIVDNISLIGSYISAQVLASPILSIYFLVKKM